ncbi:MAG: hypothetical protein WCI05_03910 [Myxococcales bacterium]
MAKTKKHRIVVVHRLSEHKHIPDFIVAVQAILMAMALAAKWFPAPDPSIEVVKADLEALIKLEGEVAAGNPLTDARDALLEVIKQHMDQWRALVQKVVNANPAQAAVIIAAAGMSQKTFTPRQKQGYSIEQGELSATVALTAPALPGGRGIHRWQMSVGGKDYAVVSERSSSVVVVKDLTSGTLHSFRHQTVIDDITSDWSEVFTIIVI